MSEKSTSIIARLRSKHRFAGETFATLTFASVVVFFLLDALQRNISQSKYDANPSETVNYWWLIVTRNGITPYIILLFAAIFLFLAVVALLHGRVGDKWKVLGIIAAAHICLILTCLNSFILTLNSTGIYLNHVETIEFNERVYHLTLVNHWAGYFTDVVYECEPSGIQCQAVLKDLSPDPYQPRKERFIVDTVENRLYAEIDNTRYLVR